MLYSAKPVELVTKPLDGQEQFTLLDAPSSGEIYPFQIVKSVSGVATPVANTDTTGFYLALSDTSATLPAHGPVDAPGGTAGGEIGSWVVKGQPAKVRVLDMAGRKAIVTVSGTLATTHIGQKKTFVQSGPYTLLDLSSAPATGGVTILELVEGTFGQPNARVLVQF